MEHLPPDQTVNRWKKQPECSCECFGVTGSLPNYLATPLSSPEGRPMKTSIEVLLDDQGRIGISPPLQNRLGLSPGMSLAVEEEESGEC